MPVQAPEFLRPLPRMQQLVRQFCTRFDRLYVRWSIYHDLFFPDRPEDHARHFEALSARTPTLFGHLKHGLLESLAVGICSLVSTDRRDVSLESLAAALPTVDDALARAATDAIRRLRELVDESRIKDMRNKLFAHFDRSVANDDLALPAVDGERLGEAMRELLWFRCELARAHGGELEAALTILPAEIAHLVDCLEAGRSRS